MVQNPFGFWNTWCFNDCAQTQSEIYINDMVSNLHCCWLHILLTVQINIYFRIFGIGSNHSAFTKFNVASHTCYKTLYTKSLDSVFAFQLNTTNLYCSMKRHPYVHCVHCRLFNVFTGCLCYILYECFHVDYAVLCCDIGNAN